MARKVRYLPPSARGRVFSRNRPPRPVVPKAEVVAPVVTPPKAKKAPPKKKAPPVAKVVEAPVVEAPVVEEVVVEEVAAPVVEEEAPVLVRARDEDGHFQSDDPSTPDVNEAYEEATPEPLWDAKMNKADLLKVAEDLGLEDLSMDNRKWEIVNALKAATS